MLLLFYIFKDIYLFIFSVYVRGCACVLGHTSQIENNFQELLLSCCEGPGLGSPIIELWQQQVPSPAVPSSQPWSVFRWRRQST